MAIRFLYFDLGNVLVNFSHQKMCAQMGQVAGLPAEKVWQVIFDTDLLQKYEDGTLDDRGFYDAFCAATGTTPDYDELKRAGSDIFCPNDAITPLVTQLRAAGHRMGILSNTCPAHWDHCRTSKYYATSKMFGTFALSYELGAIKPSPEIFARAAEQAGVAPAEIFFTDDIPGHVTAAKAAGWDAVPYTTPAALAADLRARGVMSNY